MSFAAAQGGEEGPLDQLCEADDEEVNQYEAFVHPIRECLQELQPECFEALPVCNKEVYGSDPRSAVMAKKIFCPKNPDKMKDLGPCLEKAGCKKPSGEEKKAAQRDMNVCLGSKTI
ncbi:hypothetical protein BGZ75_000858, partial [Mortierella antarctica]